MPPNLLANLQAAAQQPTAPAPVAVAVAPPTLQQQQGPLSQSPYAQPQGGLTPSAAQQQLLASAQLLSSVNPGLAAAAMAQALTMVNSLSNTAGVHHPQAHAAPPTAAPQPAAHSYPNQALLAGRHPGQHPSLGGQHPSMPGQQSPPLSMAQQHHPQQPPHIPHAGPVAAFQAPSQPPISAGAAAAQAVQYRQHQSKQRPSSVGAPSIHAMASPTMTMMAQHQQAPRPSSAMASAPTQHPVAPVVKSALLHQVSAASSLNTLNSGINHGVKPGVNQKRPSPPLATQASKVKRIPSPPKKRSPIVQIHSSSSSSLPAVPPNLSKSVATSSTVGLPKMKPVASGIHHHRGSHHHGATVAMAASAVTSSGIVPPVTPSVPPPGVAVVPHVPITVMQRWNLDQLDKHAQQLRDANQGVPQAVALLIADTRRKEEKRHAKRLANRKSACTSRARKKALIEEMTKANALLRRQALILSYLPDPVIAISTDGVITFCSMQVERVLRHDVTGLVGANIEDIIVPSSRENIRHLIRDLVIAEQRALSSSVEDGENNEEGGSHQNVGGSEGSLRENNGAVPHEVSDQSEQSVPPLLEVKVKAGQTSTEVAAGEDVSDSSGDRLPGSKNGHGSTELSSLTREKNSSFGNTDSNGSEGDQAQPGGPPTKKVKICDTNKPVGKKSPLTTTTEDDSTSSENKANAKLAKNVEMCKLNIDKNEASEQVRFLHKDDVMGASVTANNADAKLSSLMHHPSMKEKAAGSNSSSDANQPPAGEEQVASIRRKHAMGSKLPNGKQEVHSSSSSSANKKKRSGDSSEDSGYRESNESPEDEDTGSRSMEDSSMSGGSSDRSSSKKKRRRTRPLAPACNVRLIRHDLSTIWCELTSSIRTRPPNDVDNEFDIQFPSYLKQHQNNQKNGSGCNESADASTESIQEEKELLLCFRPIREGETVGEDLRFCPSASGDGENKAEAGGDGVGSPTAATSSEDGPKVSSGNSSSSKTSKYSDNDKMRTNSTSNAESNSSSADTPTLGDMQPVTAAPLAVATMMASSPTATKKKKKNRPPKKRRFEEELSEQDTQVDEKSAVESMMELAKNPSSL